MTIDEQIRQLIEQAPRYGAKPDEIQLIAPVFKAVASQLPYSQYYILQNLEQNWVMTTLKHRTQANLSKNVVYAYPSLEAVKTSVATEDPQIMALPVPVVQILFQMLAMEPVDSVIFFGPAVDQTGTEVTRQGLRQSIEQYVRSLPRSGPPPDIA